jgi:hypothetical protein
MRKRRISYVGALGLALAVAIPGSAMAAGTQTVDAGFLPQFTNNVPFPTPSQNLGNKDSKAGALYTRLYVAGFATPVPEAAIFDIHAPDELKFNTKGLAQCDPATIRNQQADAARQLCPDSLIGEGFAEVFLGQSTPGATGPTLRNDTLLFNGTPQAGNPTVLFHSTAGTPVTLISEMQQSPLPDHGTLFRTLVAQSAGGAVPNGIPIVDTGFTISKKFVDKKLKKKAKKAKQQGNTKKAKKLKKKSKKSWVQAKCTDGMGVTRVEVTYTDGRQQSADTVQPCVP